MQSALFVHELPSWSRQVLDVRAQMIPTSEQQVVSSEHDRPRVVLQDWHVPFAQVLPKVEVPLQTVTWLKQFVCDDPPVLAPPPFVLSLEHAAEAKKETLIASEKRRLTA
jgi:hypothetical protein